MSDARTTEDARFLFDSHDPDEQHTTGYWTSIPDYNRIISRLEAYEAEHEAAKALKHHWCPEGLLSEVVGNFFTASSDESHAFRTAHDHAERVRNGE